MCGDLKGVLGVFVFLSCIEMVLLFICLYITVMIPVLLYIKVFYKYIFLYIIKTDAPCFLNRKFHFHSIFCKMIGNWK